MPRSLPIISVLRMLLVAMLLAALAMSLIGCVTTTGSGATECAWVKPIHWSVKDTDQTILEIKQHNAAWKAVCKRGAGNG